MELNFEMKDGIWVASTSVNDDYNVKIETDILGDVVVSQMTCGTRPATVHAYHNIDTVDDDFDGCVWPKTIYVTCTVQPTFGAITQVS